jgi:hypothetical protein
MELELPVGINRINFAIVAQGDYVHQFNWGMIIERYSYQTESLH